LDQKLFLAAISTREEVSVGFSHVTYQKLFVAAIATYEEVSVGFSHVTVAWDTEPHPVSTGQQWLIDSIHT